MKYHPGYNLQHISLLMYKDCLLTSFSVAFLSKKSKTLVLKISKAFYTLTVYTVVLVMNLTFFVDFIILVYILIYWLIINVFIVIKIKRALNLSTQPCSILYNARKWQPIATHIHLCLRKALTRIKLAVFSCGCEAPNRLTEAYPVLYMSHAYLTYHFVRS